MPFLRHLELSKEAVRAVRNRDVRQATQHPCEPDLLGHGQVTKHDVVLRAHPEVLTHEFKVGQGVGAVDGDAPAGRGLLAMGQHGVISLVNICSMVSGACQLDEHI